MKTSRKSRRVRRDEGPDLITDRHRLAAGDRLGGRVDRCPEVGRDIAAVVGDALEPVDGCPGSAALDHARQDVEVAHGAGRRLALGPAHQGGLVLDSEDRRDRGVEGSAVPAVAVAGIADEADGGHVPGLR